MSRNSLSKRSRLFSLKSRSDAEGSQSNPRINPRRVSAITVKPKLYLRSRVVLSSALGTTKSWPDVCFLIVSMKETRGGGSSAMFGASFNSFCFSRRRICRAWKTSAKPLPKKRKAGISRNNHNRLLAALCVALRITATIKKPSPIMTLPMPLPVNSSGSFASAFDKLAPTLFLRGRFF